MRSPANDNPPADMMSKHIPGGIWIVLGMSVGIYACIATIVTGLECLFLWIHHA